MTSVRLPVHWLRENGDLRTRTMVFLHLLALQCRSSGIAHPPGGRNAQSMSLTELPNIALVGSTGAVGRECVSILESRNVPHGELRLLASKRSAGSVIAYRGDRITVQELNEDSFRGIDIAIFTASGAVSRQFAPIAVKAGATVIDNSSAFRMNEDIPLVVPEINGDVLDDFDFEEAPGIIANPNCSTIIALMAVTPLYDVAGIKRMVVST